MGLNSIGMGRGGCWAGKAPGADRLTRQFLGVCLCAWPCQASPCAVRLSLEGSVARLLQAG